MWRSGSDSRRGPSRLVARRVKTHNLLGRTRYLWKRNITLQLQVRALTEEREELIQRQTTDLETTLGLHNKVAELKQERDRLQQRLDGLRAEPQLQLHPQLLSPPRYNGRLGNGRLWPTG